jgi:hypothetical protein
MPNILRRVDIFFGTKIPVYVQRLFIIMSEDKPLLSCKHQDIISPLSADYGSAWNLDSKTSEQKVIKTLDGTIEYRSSTSHDDANPILVPKEHDEALIMTPSDSGPEFISHIVQKHDTMQGICLKVCCVWIDPMWCSELKAFLSRLTTTLVYLLFSSSSVQHHSQAIVPSK